MIKRLAAILAALALTLLVAGPALATDLHQTTPISSNDSQFQGTTDECAGTNLQPGQVLWHFVLIGTSADSGTLTATFQNAGTVSVGESSSPDSTLQFNIITGEDTLLSASTDATGDQLNLSHICQGGPPPEVPEAPMSALLVLSSGLLGVGFVAWRMRQSRTSA